MNFYQLPHVKSALEHSHKIIFNSESALLIHCTVSNVYVAECLKGSEESFARDILANPVVRLQTSNKKLQQILIPHFKFNYQCEQAIFTNTASSSCCTTILSPLTDSDLEYAAQTYEMAEYIHQLHHRQRLFGYYQDDCLIGYVAFHIDETVGALFVKPEFRRQGYGEKIMTEAFLLYKKNNPEATAFAQILTENESSIKLHKKIGCTFSNPVFWVYNEEYKY